MRIGIDGNEANTENRVGVHSYAHEILNGLYRENNKSKQKNSFIIYLKNKPREGLPKENKHWHYKVLASGKVWILTRLMPHLFFKKTVDVLFVPSHYVPLLTRVPKVCTIHDLGYLKSSGQFKKYDFWQLKCWSAISISVSKRIIAISKSTRDDIVRHCPSASEKTSVVLHGYDKTRFNIKVSSTNVRRVQSKYKTSDNYILFLSMLKPSKNIKGLLRAYSMLDGKVRGNTKMVIAGKKGWLYESIFKLTKDLVLEEKVVFTGFVDEKDKAALYYGAKLFALPAHWEGFGMTVLESMASGTPVVVSKVGGLPEVAGNAGVYVGKDDSSIANGLAKILSMSENEYDKLVKRGLEQAKKFSWEKAARETLDVIKSAVN